MASFLLLIGAAKSGTTSLFSLLEKHPEILGSTNKEPDYFCIPRSTQAADFESYLNLWGDIGSSAHAKWLLEASTSYTKFPAIENVPANILGSGISCKFIYIMRDPFKRIESHWQWNQADKNWSHAIDGIYLRSVSNYYLQLSRYIKYFPAENFHLLTLEELIASPQRSLAAIAQFLEISSAPFESIPLNNENVTQSQSVGERFLLRADDAKLLLRLPRSIKNIGKYVLRASTPQAPRATLSSSQRKEIYEYLAPYMIRLAAEFGVNVAQWGFH